MYKFINSKMQTHLKCTWKVGEWKYSNFVGEIKPFSCGGFYAYPSLELAVLLCPCLSPAYYDNNSKLFRVQVDGEKKSYFGLMTRHQHLCLIEEVEIPSITQKQRYNFAMLCSKETKTFTYKDSTSGLAWAAVRSVINSPVDFVELAKQALDK